MTLVQLRDIEIEIGTRLEMADDELGPTERDALLKMQQILYATEVCLHTLSWRCIGADESGV